MATILGRQLSKMEILKRVGDISQLAGIRSVRLQDGPEDGARVYEFRTGAGFDFDVTADRGFDISKAVFKGQPLHWRSGSLDQHPSFFDDSGAGWLRTFPGGLLTTCGLSNVGSPCEDDGKQYGVHGRISATPAREVYVSQYWDGDDFIMEAGGKMRESVIFGENLLLERKVSCKLGESKLTIRDRVTNETFSKTPLMILYHINIGYPVVDSGSKLYAPAIKTTPRDTDAEVEAEKCFEMLGPTPHFAERVYFHEMKPDSDGLVTCALVNENLPSGPFGVYITYSHSTLPNLVQWKMNGEGTYVCGIEPANCLVMGRAAQRQSGTLVELDPFESHEFFVEIGVISGQNQLGSIKKKCSLEGC